jgi:CHRD domain-containing protein
MYRRVFNILGVATLVVTSIAVPAEGATCAELELSSPLDASVKNQVVANMDGQQVVSSNGAQGVGDPDGAGTVVLTLQTVSKQSADIAFQIQTNNIALPLEGAHIHKAPPGMTWVAAVTLFGFSDQSDRSGVVTVSKCLAHEIFHGPADFYVDVHNQEYPDQGAVRGQLSSAR